MFALDVEIMRFVDAHQPGFVECVITDAGGGKHFFVDKVPVVTLEDLDEHSLYPRRGMIQCVVLQRWRDSNGTELASVDTSSPWAIETTDGQTQFDVLASQLTSL